MVAQRRLRKRRRLRRRARARARRAKAVKWALDGVVKYGGGFALLAGHLAATETVFLYLRNFKERKLEFVQFMLGTLPLCFALGWAVAWPFEVAWSHARENLVVPFVDSVVEGFVQTQEAVFAFKPVADGNSSASARPVK